MRAFLYDLNKMYSEEKSGVKGSSRHNKPGLRFDIADNDVMWFEIHIPKNLQMPFSEFEIHKNLKHMA